MPNTKTAAKANTKTAAKANTKTAANTKTVTTLAPREYAFMSTIAIDKLANDSAKLACYELVGIMERADRTEAAFAGQIAKLYTLFNAKMIPEFKTFGEMTESLFGIKKAMALNYVKVSSFIYSGEDENGKTVFTDVFTNFQRKPFSITALVKFAYFIGTKSDSAKREKWLKTQISKKNPSITSEMSIAAIQKVLATYGAPVRATAQSAQNTQDNAQSAQSAQNTQDNAQSAKSAQNTQDNAQSAKSAQNTQDNAQSAQSAQNTQDAIQVSMSTDTAIAIKLELLKVFEGTDYKKEKPALTALFNIINEKFKEK